MSVPADDPTTDTSATPAPEPTSTPAPASDAPTAPIEVEEQPRETQISEPASKTARLQEAVEGLIRDTPDPRDEPPAGAQESDRGGDQSPPPAEDSPDDSAAAPKPAPTAGEGKAAVSKSDAGDKGADAVAPDGGAKPEAPASLDDIRKLAVANRAERAKKAEAEKATEQAATDAGELQRLRLENEQIRAGMAQMQADPLAALARLTGREPLEVFDDMTKRALGEQGAQLPTSPGQPGSDAMAEIEKLRAEIRDRDTQATQAAEVQQRRETHERAGNLFAEFAGDAEKFPLLSTEPEATRALVGHQIGAELRDAGLPVDFETVARYAEQELDAQYQRMHARRSGSTAEGDPKQPKKDDPGADGEPKRGKKTPATLTNAQAASRSPRQQRASTREDRLRAAHQELMGSKP